MVQNPRPRGACTSAPSSSLAPSFRPGACKIKLLKCSRSVLSQKRTLKTLGRRGRGQIKNACAQDQKGEEWGAARRPSKGRERRRRRAEDVGVVLGEAARVRDVGLFHQIADVRPELRRRAARAPVLGEERRRRRQEQVVVDGRRGPRRPRARARRRRLDLRLRRVMLSELRSDLQRYLLCGRFIIAFSYVAMKYDGRAGPRSARRACNLTFGGYNHGQCCTRNADANALTHQQEAHASETICPGTCDISVLLAPMSPVLRVPYDISRTCEVTIN